MRKTIAVKIYIDKYLGRIMCISEKLIRINLREYLCDY